MDRLPLVRRAIAFEPSFPQGLFWSFVAVTVPLELRWLIDSGRGGVEFVTIFPTVVIASLALGWRWATLVTVLSAILVNRLFRHESALDWLVDGRDMVMVGLFVFSCAILIAVGAMVRRLVRQEEAAIQREEMHNRELVHRVKNMLATANALAAMTARHSPGEFITAFSGRIDALGKATQLLASGEVGRCELHRLIEDAISPFYEDDRFVVEGPACTLPGKSCVPLALALHELCTNASKFGALSSDEGRVSIIWTVGEGSSKGLRLVWREMGGPPVTPPERTGMGSRLLNAQEGLDAVALDYRPDGVSCEFTIAKVGRAT